MSGDLWTTLSKTQQSALKQLANSNQPRATAQVLDMGEMGYIGVRNGDEMYLSSVGEALIYRAIVDHLVPLPHVSFALTTPQIKARTKRVTRRSGTRPYRPGQLIWAVNKAMGFKKGEHPVRLALLRVVSSRWEPLDVITYEECILEGFPEDGPQWFIAMYCRANKVKPDSLVQRIAFEYVEEPF